MSDTDTEPDRNRAVLDRFEGRGDGMDDSVSVPEVLDQRRNERDARNADQAS